jgi:predicted nuclease of predicted toxin-antitoxin system
MRLKLDENLSRHLKGARSSLGHDVLTVADEKLLSHPDTDVAAAASREQRILFTFDVEFADLRKYPPGSHPGIILFRPASLGPLTVNRFVLDFVRSAKVEELMGAVAIVDASRVRVRYPEIKG